tara:strand:+ start:316 stop:510 length:195 start_codon:yes stop_codon:yes gene_type:complete
VIRLTENFEKILEKLESKQRDCLSFSKKYKTREMENLYQYYEGANWAIKYAISLLKNDKESSDF